MKKRNLEQEAKIKKLEKYCEAHNRAPVTRRDFLSAGLISFTGYMVMPTLGTLLASSGIANAADPQCATAPAGAALAPFITLNLAGGAMLGANFVPMDVNRQPLATYNDMGLGNGQVPIVREFNNAPFAGAGISKLLTSLQANSAVTTRANTAFVGVCARSRDDTGDNMMDISGMVARAGLAGDQLPNLGRRDTDTGLNQKFALVKPPAPLVVGNYRTMTGALGAAGSLATLNPTQKASFYQLIRNLSSSEAKRIASFSGGDTLSKLMNCATDRNVELAAKTGADLDPRLNPAVAQVWGINANSADGDENVVFAAMVMAALTGKAGTVALERGGYDYHDNSRTTGDTRDGEAGVIIGRILQTAAVLNQKVFLYVTTDGACRSARSEARNAPWTSDRGEAGTTYMLAYDPAGRPATNDFQLGQFTAGQTADERFVTGGSPQLAAAGVFANYLQFSKKISLLDQIIPGTFSAADLAKILKFG